MGLEEVICDALNILENWPSEDIDEIKRNVANQKNEVTRLQNQTRMIQREVDNLKEDTIRLVDSKNEKIDKIDQSKSESRGLQSTLQNKQPVLKKFENEIRTLQIQIQNVRDGVSETDKRRLEDVKAKVRAYRLTGVFIDMSKNDRFEGFVFNPATRIVKPYALDDSTKGRIWDIIQSTTLLIDE